MASMAYDTWITLPEGWTDTEQEEQPVMVQVLHYQRSHGRVVDAVMSYGQINASAWEQFKRLPGVVLADAG